MVEKSKKILIIDDDADIVESVSLILKSAGFEVVSAGTAAEGIRKAQEEMPDMVLCDMMMETSDSGISAAREIKHSCPRSPIILLSSIAAATDGHADIAGIGFSATLQKPIDSRNLLRTVKTILK